MFRISENFVFLCVLAQGLALYVVKDECPANEEYLLCGSACPANCTSPDVESCIDVCAEGCFCKPGFLRNDNGTCVNADQCVNGKPVCGENEEFLSCGSACPESCQQQESICIDECVQGCFCKAGFVRDETSKKCVALDKCPVEQCLNQNEVYDICSASCEPSCADPEPICAKACTGGCVCAAGLFRSDAGDCVSVDKCPARNGTDPGVLGKYLVVINRILHL